MYGGSLTMDTIEKPSACSPAMDSESFPALRLLVPTDNRPPGIQH